MAEKIMPDDIVIGLGKIAVALSSLNYTLLKALSKQDTKEARDEAVRNYIFTPTSERVRLVDSMSKGDFRFPPIVARCEWLLPTYWQVHEGAAKPTVFAVGYQIGLDGAVARYSEQIDAAELETLAAVLTDAAQHLEASIDHRSTRH